MLVVRAVVVSKQEIDAHAWWKLGGAAESAFSRIEARADGAIRVVEHARVDSLTGGCRTDLTAQLIPETFRILDDFLFAAPVRGRDRFKHPEEPRAVVTILGREVCSSEDRLARRQENSRQRPAPAAGHHLYGGHVYLIEVGPF